MAFDSKNRCMQKTCLLALFVKMCLEWPAGHDKHEIKNKFSAEYGQSETEAIQTTKSNQDADEPGAALVDDPFQRFLQAGAGLLRHMQQLALQALVHQLVQALAKYI